MSWRILITNSVLAERAGTVTVVRDLALGLQAAGHSPMVYSPEAGDVADEMRSRGIPVVSDFALLPATPDIVHGNQHVEMVQALLRFSSAQGVFVCHHRTDPMAAPPRMSRIRRYVAVDHNCLERLIEEYGIPKEACRVIYNSVDTDRFRAREPLPTRPRRAVLFSNYARPGSYLDAVRHACALADLPLDVIGSRSGNPSTAPELLLGRYDLAFAKARCALEAMAVGLAVVLCDEMGLGPMVTADEVANLRQWNFGRRVLRDPHDPDAILRQMARYDPADAATVSEYIRRDADLPFSVQAYVRVYDEVMEEPVAAMPAAREIEEYVRNTATRMHELDKELRQYRRPYRMEPLSDDACASLKLRIVTCPDEVRSRHAFIAQVEVKNGSRERLGAFPPYPINFSYRWFDAADGDIVVEEGARTMLTPALPPGETAVFQVRIVPPAGPDKYRLRVTLVQELVRWLDASGAGDEAVVHVVPPDETFKSA
jgi:hypothetical protein